MEKEPSIKELRQTYTKLTGKRPIYNSKATKGYRLFLDNLLAIRFGKSLSNAT